VTAPFYAWSHAAKVVPGESCPTGSSSSAGLSFYVDGPYPNDYDGALFFSDYSRDCIWVMKRTGGALPDPAAVTTFAAGAANPVDVQVGPDGELYYADFDGGTIRRIGYTAANQSPVAVANATPTSGPTPLNVSFSGGASSDADPGDTITYAWDLDGDGAYDDSSAENPMYTYTTAGTYTASLQVTDNHGATGRATVTITAGNRAPTATITSPAAGARWKVGETITFGGSASDPDEGPLPPSALSWSLVLFHCPSNCHTHPLAELPGRGGRLVRDPRSRVSVLPRAAAHGDRLRRTHGHEDRAARPADGEPHAELQPDRAHARPQRQERGGALHADRDRRLQQLDRGAVAAGRGQPDVDVAALVRRRRANPQPRRKRNRHAHRHVPLQRRLVGVPLRRGRLRAPRWRRGARGAARC
jgi:hypothetical protein